MNFKTCAWTLVFVVLLGLRSSMTAVEPRMEAGPVIVKSTGTHPINGALLTTVRSSMTAVEPRMEAGPVIVKSTGTQLPSSTINRQDIVDRLRRLEVFEAIITSLMNTKKGVPRSFLNHIKGLIG